MIKKITSLIIVFSFCFITESTFGFDNSSLLPSVKKTLKYAKRNKTRKAAELYSRFGEKEALQFAEYIEKNPGEVAPIFFILVSDNVYREDEDRAAFLYSFGKVRALEDANMCIDKSAAEQIKNYAMVAPRTVDYLKSKTYDYKYNKALFDKVIEKDKQSLKRFNPIWACEYGNEILFKKPKLVPESEFSKIIEAVRKHAEGAADKIKDYNDKND